MKIARYFLILILVSIFSYSPSVLAQVVNIPDPNLRAAIAETLGKPVRSQITRSDMVGLTRLIAHDRGIANLRGLEFATHLGEIRMNDNSIRDLSFLSGLLRMHTIEFRRNEIRDLSPIAGLVNLRWLIVEENFIEDLSPISDFVHLDGLAVSGNLISDFTPVENLTKLTRIWMSENPIADLSVFEGLVSLREYHSWGTPILNLSGLAKLPSLRKLDICGGEISDLSPLSEATHLRELYLAGNEITDVSPLANLTGLTTLNLKHNQISDVSGLSGLANLRRLYLEHNLIRDFSPLLAFGDHVIIGKRGNLGVLSGGVTHNYHGSPPAGPKITGPWLWVIVPGTWLGNTDWLAEASGGFVTEQKVATLGAREGKSVGRSKWRAHSLSPVGHDNINDMTDALGWGRRDAIYDHIVYGVVSLKSPRPQETTMLVGSDDGVKVWLNGELVHEALIDRGADDYQDAFPVTLKQGTNVLLVAVDNNGHGDFSGFFGFAAGTSYSVNPPDTQLRAIPAWDVNKDGDVSILDLILVAQDFGKARSSNPRTDVNKDGKRNILDLNLVAKHIDAAGVAAAPALREDSDISPAMIASWIARAEAVSDGSLAFREGIATLKRLLATLTPKRTALLSNYPNPFNPETWIPYELAKDSDVRVRIYDARGVVVRTLWLGHQPAGRYQEKHRAAYWDGRNALGEPVASGLYFYTLTAGDFSGTGKMLIRK